MSINQLKKDLQKYASKEKAYTFQRFFKTAPGEYGEGDRFIGITVPNCRTVANKNLHLSLRDTQKLISSKIHEERLVALLILVEQFKKADVKIKKRIFNFYLKNTKYINNWDLVDLSAPKIVGEYLHENPYCATILQGGSLKGKETLDRLAKPDNLWERRIAILSTFAFIRKGNYSQTLEIAKILLNDKHDLIHKAVGWMLREVGKINQETEEKFLNKYYKKMPRTMLRYAIKRFDEDKRRVYLMGNI